MLLVCPSAALAQGAGTMLEVELASGVYEGQAISWSERSIMLLARDGQLLSFRPQDVRRFRQIAPRSLAYSSSELRARLLQEFGSGFDLTSTAHYLVVHPRGQRDLWAERFEQLYRSFYRYFQIRGLAPREPAFPLIAIVFKTHDDYLRYCAQLGQQVPSSFLGHYWGTSNRVYLYDASQSGANWEQNAATIVHEATHQVAFNSGVHGRFSDTPRWLSEGLAMMFESPAVWNGKAFHTQHDRIHVQQLTAFHQYLARRKPDALAALLSSDNRFKSDPTGAYAESWCLSFYLSETQPTKYAQYLARVAARPSFQTATPQQRLADFAAVFGSDLKMLDARFLRFMATLK